ncbi:MAG: cobaltochelatase CobN, partial [Archaeoglobaceae archaeon]|nr:cobaltochelatase CobN [Archaeoglobaceae archaeon]
ENNIYALEEITRRLIEANERRLWNADEEILKRIKGVYGEIEGMLEEELVGDVQGGVVEFLSPDEVKSWSENISDVLKAWRMIK